MSEQFFAAPSCGRAVAALGLALASLACGSVSSTSSSTFGTPVPAASPPYIVTVTAAGVTPQVTHIWQGRSVIFRNDDTRAHSFFSDLHPAHLECTGLLNLGPLRPGERREINDVPLQACFFHNDEDPNSRAFQGVVVGH